MGVMITIYYHNQALLHDEAQFLTTGLQSVVSTVMEKKDVFAIANHDQYAAASNPIEVFVQVNRAKIDNPADLTEKIAAALIAWKQNNNFDYQINLNVMPVEWHAKLGI